MNFQLLLVLKHYNLYATVSQGASAILEIIFEFLIFWNDNKIWETRKIFANNTLGKVW